MNQEIKDAYNNCKVEESLHVNDPRYVDFSGRHLRGDDGDIVDSLLTGIELSNEPVRLLASGFRGCGKTTELYRLKDELERGGYDVIFVDVEDYLNLKMPATVSDLWLTIAGGFDAYLEAQGAFEAGVRRLWDRVVSFINREVEFSDAKVKLGAKEGFEAGVEFKVALKENPDFRETLNEKIEAKRPELVHECRNFVIECIGLLAKHNGGRSREGTVLILDAFEKLQGDYRNADAVRRSAEELFVRDWRLLETPCHTVFTVPPWLAFVEAGVNTELGRTHLLSMCKVREKDGSPCGEGEDALLELLDKRMDLEKIFDEVETLRPLIRMSGGYPRDLLRMIREVLERNARIEKLPIATAKLREDVERVIDRMVEQYAFAMDGEDLPLLARIAIDKGISGWSQQDKLRIAELFESHVVMSYQNGERWLDLHPAVEASNHLKRAIDSTKHAKMKSSTG